MTDSKLGGAALGPATAVTAWVCDERCFWHDTGNAAGYLGPGGWLEPLGHVESPATKKRLANLAAASGLLERLRQVRPAPASDEQILAVHTPDYLSRIKAASAELGGDAGDGTSRFASGGFEIAALSAGAAITAVAMVLDSEVTNAYAISRPPGHHALPDTGMGYCIFNNIAIAIHAARAASPTPLRIAVVDWDVHHGNGTQHCFYEDPETLTLSIHQDRCYPTDSGFLTEHGAGDGFGANINLPLPAGSGDGAYQHAIEQVVLPALRRFAPDLVIVGCGYDASGFDSMGRMQLHSESYRSMIKSLLDQCDGRLAVIHEGGYSDFYVPFCGHAVLEAMSGVDTEVEDPYLADLRAAGGQELNATQREAIAAVAAHLDEIPGRQS